MSIFHKNLNSNSTMLVDVYSQLASCRKTVVVLAALGFHVDFVEDVSCRFGFQCVSLEDMTQNRHLPNLDRFLYKSRIRSCPKYVDLYYLTLQ